MKKRDRDSLAASMAAARGGEHRRSGSTSGGSPFSLSRFLPSRSRRRNRSKSRMSLDSDSTRSESSLASHALTSSSLPAVHGGITSAPLPRASNNCNLNSAASGPMGSECLALSPGGPVLSASGLPASSVSSVASRKHAVGGESPSKECPVCLTEQNLECFPPIQTCHHRSCVQCLRQYLQIEISESRVNIACPECNERFHPNDMRLILDDSVIMAKYEDFMLRRVLAMDPDTRWCPAPDCGYAVIAAGCAGCPKLKCERAGCDTYFCYHCKQHWHPNQTCDAARAERSPNIRSASVSYSHESSAQNEIKPCPRCGAFIVKMNDGSCNHMTCAVCAAEFCWLCMKEISDLHYLSPSGCTFWGRKPWSRKKKILWQLGTLVGAPVGITLVAGIAVPAMIIGIPVWVGRKIHARYRMASRHRRTLAVTGGVAASILASPVIAGLAVGIGVPILLAYVYGVVPISLCRSGGCGVTTTNTGGVRFEFDEENEGNAQGNFSGDNHSESMPAVANPSIAPSIGDASLGMTNSLSASGSHMDRVGVLRDADSDRDSASNRAIAGASLNGSLCGSTYTNKLEVQADVVPGGGTQKRASFSSESANISLSEKSATVSFDEAGMRVYYSDPHTRDAGEVDIASDNGENRSVGSPVMESCDTGSAVPGNGPQSPRVGLRSMEDGKQGVKCKKFTRFVDDIPGLSANLGVSVDTGSRTPCKGLEQASGEGAKKKEVVTAGSAGDDGAGLERADGRANKWLLEKDDAGRVLSRRAAGWSVPWLSSVESDGAASCTDVQLSGSSMVPEVSTEETAPSDSAAAHISIAGDAGAGGVAMPEVDTDKPVASRQSSLSPSDIDSGLLLSRGRSLSLSCSSLDKKQAEAGSLCADSLSQTDDSELRTLRRHSYELAYRHGRISPVLSEDSH